MNDDLLQYIIKTPDFPTQYKDCGNVEDAINIVNTLISRVNQMISFTKFHNKTKWLRE